MLAIAGLASRVNKYFDKDDIHRFRVSVKTLRSFLHLVRINNPDSKLRFSKKFKRLYHIAGSVRDAQLELQKITEQQLALPAYTMKLLHVMKTMQAEWQKHYSEKTLSKLASRLGNFSYSSLQPASLEEFTTSRITFIKHCGDSLPLKDSTIHLARKQAKDIMYISGIVQKKWDAVSAQVKLWPLKKLEVFAETSGSYHDAQVQLDHLIAFSSKKIQQEEKELIDKLCNAEEKRLKKKIVVIRKLLKTIG